MIVVYHGRGTGLRLSDRERPPYGRILDVCRMPGGAGGMTLFMSQKPGEGVQIDLNRTETLLLIEAALATLTPEPVSGMATT